MGKNRKNPIKYKDNSGRVRDVKFNVGDTVRIIDLGCQYPTFTKAFKHFGIMDLTKESTSDNIQWHTLDYDYDLGSNFIVLGVALHPDFLNEVLYHCSNTKRQHIVIGQDGLELRNRKEATEPTEKIIERISKE